LRKMEAWAARCRFYVVLLYGVGIWESRTDRKRSMKKREINEQ
jgi:hypothetical protein